MPDCQNNAQPNVTVDTVDTESWSAGRWYRSVYNFCAGNTTVVRHLPPILHRACGRCAKGARFIRLKSRQEVTTISCQIKYWPCRLYGTTWRSRELFFLLSVCCQFAVSLLSVCCQFAVSLLSVCCQFAGDCYEITGVTGVKFGTVSARDVPTGYVCSAVYTASSSLLYIVGRKM